MFKMAWSSGTYKLVGCEWCGRGLLLLSVGYLIQDAPYLAACCVLMGSYSALTGVCLWIKGVHESWTRL